MPECFTIYVANNDKRIYTFNEAAHNHVNRKDMDYA